MPYAKRDAEGHVVALATRPESAADELLDIAHPDVIAFLRDGPTPDALARLQVSDAEMARVTEDLVDVLVARNVLRFTDLPAAAQQKLLARRALRQELEPLEPLVGEVNDVI